MILSAPLVAWLLLATQFTVKAQPSRMRGVGNQKKVGLGNQKKVKDELEKFKEDHLILPSAVLQKQKVSDFGTITANGKTYSLDNLQPYNVFSRNARIMVDGEPRPLEDSSRRARLFKSKGDDGETILVTKEGYLDDDDGGDIKSVNIINRDGSEVVMEALQDGSLVSIRPEDMDTDKLQLFDFGEGVSGDIVLSQLHNRNNRKLQESCNTFKVVEVAVAYDSTFCTQVASNSESTARSVVEAAIARADALFEPGCVKVRLSYLEGFCSQAQDPYTSAANADNIGCDGTRGSLHIFQDIWETSRRNVNRDTAHFFVGRDFPGSTIGCAASPALCNSDSYGVNQFSFSTNSLLQGNLFAHELGHNMGALHISDPNDTGDFLMEPSLNSASDGVSSQSSSSILEYLNTRSCVSTEDVDDGGDNGDNDGDNGGGGGDDGDTPGGDDGDNGGDDGDNNNGDNDGDGDGDNDGDNDGDDGDNNNGDGPFHKNDSFRLENLKNRGYCVSIQGIVAEKNSPVNLEPCDDAAPAQSWYWNEQTHLLHSILDDTKCLLPLDNAENGAPLVLWDCDPSLSYGQWSYFNDQTIRLDYADKCLDVKNPFRFRTTLQMWQCNRARDKRWLVR